MQCNYLQKHWGFYDVRWPRPFALAAAGLASYPCGDGQPASQAPVARRTSNFGLQVLPAGRDHVHHVKAARGEYLLDVDCALRSAASPAAGHADTDRAFPCQAFLALCPRKTPSTAFGQLTARQRQALDGRGKRRLVVGNRQLAA